MAKIAQVSSKYIIHSDIKIEGIVDRPDVIGAIFGQTEGLLGEDLELRELQKSGRIGRIEVNTNTKAGKTTGEIIIPSSLDKAETAIIGAALEVIQRIGPCNAKIHVGSIEDIRVSKRAQVVSRAKELLKDLIDGVIPDSREIADEVAYSVRVTELTSYGTEKLAAGPLIEDSDEVIVVEGRADVLTLLKYGFKNVIAVGGTNIPKTILGLCKEKTTTVFVDGDRGGDLIIRELMSQTDVDFVTKAPDGKEVEELTKKEIHKALRAKIASEQVHLESSNTSTPAHNLQRKDSKRETRPRNDDRKDNRRTTDSRRTTNSRTRERAPARRETTSGPSEKEKKEFNKMLEDLIGTRGAYLLDRSLSILGKIPVSELEATVKSLNNAVYAVVFDGDTTQDLYDVSEKSNVKYVIGMTAKKIKTSGKTKVLTPENLV